MHENDESTKNLPFPTRAILFDYHFLHHHPLAQSIEPAELALLAARLQARFARTGVDLDGPVNAVVDTREAATVYARQARQAGETFTDEDHLEIVREIAAYLGLSYLCISKKSTWLKGECLLEVSVGEERRIEFVRGRERKTVTRMTISIGFLSSDLWDLALSGSTEPLDLYMTIYVEWPDGHAEWEEPRVRFLFGNGDENSFPSAWRANGL